MERMSRWGIGPLFAGVSVLYGMLMIGLSRIYYPAFQIKAMMHPMVRYAGLVLMLVGFVFFLIAIVYVHRAYNADRLVTEGIYRCCRHPLYAGWAVLIVPGMAMMLGNWLSLTIPLVMYGLLRYLVKKEEVYLEERFGDGYRNYRKRVPCILPYGLLLRSRQPIETLG